MSVPDFTTGSNLMLKVCGMRSAANIQEVVLLQPNWLGFIFYPKSARYVGEELDQNTLEKIPCSIKKVGVFVNAELSEILTSVKKYTLEAVQLHGEESPDFCRKLQGKNILVLKAFSVIDDFDFQKLGAYEGTCDYYLFDTKGQYYGGNGTTFNWGILQNYTGQTPFFLSGGIDVSHADQIKKLKIPLMRGLDINSRFETSPAVKDVAKVRAFLNQIRNT